MNQMSHRRAHPTSSIPCSAAVPFDKLRACPAAPGAGWKPALRPHRTGITAGNGQGAATLNMKWNYSLTRILARIFHQCHSAGGAKEFSPGRKPWESSSLLRTSPGRGERNQSWHSTILGFLSPLPGLSRLAFASQHSRAGLESVAPFGGSHGEISGLVILLCLFWLLGTTALWAQQEPSPTVPPAPGPTQVAPGAEETVPIALHLENADLRQVIGIIAAELKINYVIDPKVEGTVNINTLGEVRRSDLFPLLQMILRINGATAVQTGNFYRIVPLSEMQRLPIEPGLDRPAADWDQRSPRV